MNKLAKAIKAFGKGGMVIVIDDRHREDEGDLIMAAQDANPKSINFMITHGRGLVCVPMERKRLKELDLPIMVEKNEEATKCIFTISTDARKSISTGISASDRAATIRLLANPKSTANDFVRPGHVFPLMAAHRGLKVRKGHTEASLELCRLSGLKPVAAICEIIGKNGKMAKLPELKKMAKKFNLKILKIKDLIG